MSDDTPSVDMKDVPDPAPHTGQQKAVAILYDEKIDEAPRVVASGKGAVAEQILALAFAHGVRVREDTALVEILEALDVDSPIPLEAFAAVAEILSYVYRANDTYSRTASAERTMP